MTQKTVHVVWAHPREDSLTSAVVAEIIEGFTAAGLHVDELDLYRSGFDPVLHEADEPDWNDLDKRLSETAVELGERARAADAVVLVFPVWWFSLPAMLKGYIDRVWNHGVFYGGGRKSGISVARWVGLAGETEAWFQKRNYDEMIHHHLNVGIAGYCGISDTKVELLYETLSEGEEDDERLTRLESQAQSITREVLDSMNN